MDTNGHKLQRHAINLSGYSEENLFNKQLGFTCWIVCQYFVPHLSWFWSDNILVRFQIFLVQVPHEMFFHTKFLQKRISGLIVECNENINNQMTYLCFCIHTLLIIVYGKDYPHPHNIVYRCRFLEVTLVFHQMLYFIHKKVVRFVLLSIFSKYFYRIWLRRLRIGLLPGELMKPLQVPILFRRNASTVITM